MSLDNFDITHGEDLYIDRFRIGTVLSRNEVLKKDAVLPGDLVLRSCKIQTII